ncbi:diaminobutyrate--2-oxoglutarate transaminase family protein [Pseudomonas entomophila]|uniref:diaminobutyrate--2-oxoglutarate transaminase family protein n=1 Tax=Pseudomonas entomophila TaxID=312306 RepID=UPI0015E37130|nr:diaminobutyrate--2-oxoglutarate transaminase family protein [Pseudomonas entomophila]MBA1194430.1 diaminobutyrate--2-oxoglutarate transaminase family protein [Pseudomonas entomophila]
MTPNALHMLATRESNARTYARNIPRILSHGQGAEVIDSEGRHYLDCLACAGALPLGHNHPFVRDRVIAFLQSGQLQQALDIATPAKVDFIEELYRALPAEFAASARFQLCGPTGADAAEAALKLFKTATGRRPVIVFQGAYHGMTHGTLGMMGNLAPKQAISGLPGEVQFVPYPYAFRSSFGTGMDAADTDTLSLACLDNLLSDPESGVGKPAMVLLEAIQGEGGCIPASAQWLRQVREITTRHQVPLVIDEIQSGIGRSGDMFAFEHAGITPDAILLSKAIGGGYPLSVLVYLEQYDLWKPGAHAGTFRGNQIALVSGAATLEYIRQEGLLEHVRQVGAQLREGLLRLQQQHACIGDVRGRGLMLGMELVDPEGALDAQGHRLAAGELATQVKRACLDEGLLIETGGRHGAVLRFLPPLVITCAQVEQILQRLGRALQRTRAHAPQVVPTLEAQA